MQNVRMQNATDKPTNRWRNVSIGNRDVYILLNMPIAIPSQKSIFGRFKSGDELIAANIKGERAGNGDADWNRDSNMRNSNIDSMRDGGVQLAGGVGEHEHPNKENKRNIPMPSRPPIWYPDHPYGHVKHHCQCRRIKIISVKVNPVQEDEIPHRVHTSTARPLRNLSRCFLEVYRSRCQCGQIKFKPTKLKIEHFNDKKA